jgi:deoxycytidylate deaminase
VQNILKTTMKASLMEYCIRTVKSKHNSTHPCWKYKAQHYSFIIVNDEVISMGMNRPANVPKHFGYPKSAMLHAEVDAYRRARHRIGHREFEIFNVRLGKDKTVKMSAPCPACMNLMFANGCTKIYYTTDKDVVGSISF